MPEFSRSIFGIRLVVVVILAFALATMTTAVAAPKKSTTRSSAPATLTVSPGKAHPGTESRLSGSGFASLTAGRIIYQGNSVASVRTNRNGRFSKSWNVPENARTGKVHVQIAGKRASTRLQIIPPPETTPPETTVPETPAPETSVPDTTVPETTMPEDPGHGDHGSESPEVPGDTSFERWSDPATWGGSVPAAGEQVTVPAGKNILLDTDTAPLGGLTVNGTLRFADEDETLTAGYIMVHGKMEVGTEEDPYESRAKIILTGSDRDQDIMKMGAKLIGVMGGTLDVHGEENRDGWTKLSRTAAKGQNRITLENDPGWRVGDEVVIASTDYDFRQAEEARITAVSGNTFTLDRNLTNTHFGVDQNFAGRTVDERAEVALLNRNVTIEGEKSSSADGFGGQIMAMNGGKLRMEGAELRRMGQKNILRRYPVHLHMLGDSGADSYLKDNVLRNSFNRCVTIHGTNELLVQGNTCYDTIGHGFFMEDGAEVRNTLDGNLALGIRRPAEGERLLESDRQPAAFWITNPDNTVTDNVAAGSEGMGFWYAFPKNPTGLSADETIWPRRTPLGESSGNVAHSNLLSGFFVDNGPTENGSTEATFYKPLTDPTNPESPTVKATFSDLTAYRNREWGVWLRGYDHTVENSVLADNAIGATFASDESYLVDSLVVGQTNNLGNPTPWEINEARVGPDGRSLPMPWDRTFPVRGFEFYDGKVGTRDTTFVNFQPNTVHQASAIGMRLENHFGLDPQNYLTGATFINSKPLHLQEPGAGLDGEKSLVFRDADGSLTGTQNAVITSNVPFLTRSGCTKNNDWNAYICPPTLDHVGLGVGTMYGSPSTIKPVTLKTAQGRVQTLRGSEDYSTSAYTNVVAGEMYEVTFNGGTPTNERLQFILRDGSAKNVTIKVPYSGSPKVLRWGDNDMGPEGKPWAQGVQVNSVAELRSSTVQKSSYYHDAANGMLYIKIVAKMPDPNDRRNIDWVDVQVVPG